MKPISFWRDLMPLLLVCVLVTTISSIWLPVWAGLGFTIVMLLWRLSSHYREMNHFALWLMNPTSKNVPSGHGVWTDVFATLYSLRRIDEHNQAQLAEWLARFQNTMSHLPDGVVIMSRDGYLEWCNPVAEKHFKFTLKDDKGNRLTNLVREPILVNYIQSLQFEYSIKVQCFQRELEVTLIDFEAERVILVSRDITETEKVDAMRRDFIANASHELRTPLTVISGFLEYAKEDPDQPLAERKRQINLMHKQAEHMTVLVQDMLILSRLESDVLIDNVVIDMESMLNDQITQAQALSGGIHVFDVNISKLKLQGSAQEISSVVSNLLSNAVRYSPEGGVISLFWGLKNDQYVLSVKDTGQGISSEHIPRLTERFYRVNKDQSRASKGTGLGLAIVKHILLRHQAHLVIESEVGQGSQFSAVFPRQRIVY